MVEIEPQGLAALRDALNIGLFAATHLVIQANRRIIRPRIDSKWPSVAHGYNTVSQYAEHIASYTTLPFGFNSALNLGRSFLGMPPSSSDRGIGLAFIRAYLVDMVIPTLITGKAHFRDMLSNLAGIAIYYYLLK